MQNSLFRHILIMADHEGKNIVVHSDEDLDLAAENVVAFNELKKRINGPSNSTIVDDFKLLRFLKARNFDVDKAESMLRKHLSWRKEENVDTVLEDYKIPEVIEKYYPIFIAGYCLDGQPFVVFQFGDADLKGVLKSLKPEMLLRHFIYLLEYAELCLQKQSEKLGKRFEKWKAVGNFENCTLSQVTSRACIQHLCVAICMYEANYPERLQSAYIINANAYLPPLFNILKPIVAPNTLKKLSIFGKDGWKEALGKIIGPDLLAILGDNRGDIKDLKDCFPPYNAGGKVPKSYYFGSDERRLGYKPGVIKCKVKRNEKLSIPVKVKTAGSFLDWKFEIDNYDILFGLFYKSTDNENEPPKPLIKNQKVDSDLEYETGCYLCQEPGIYILTFDNSYSWFRQKTICCIVSVTEPGEKKIVD